MRKITSLGDIVLLLFLNIGFFWRSIFENKFLYFGGDLIDFYNNFYRLSILSDFPSSLAKKFGLSIFYPTNFIMSFAIHWSKGMNTGFRIMEFYFILHIFWFSVFTYLLIRFGFSLNRYASLFGAIGFSYAGIFATHILNFNFFQSIALLPLIWLFFILGLQNKRRYFLVSGALLGLTAFTGSLTGAYFASLTIISYFLFMMLFDNRIKVSSFCLNTALVLIIGWLICFAFKFINYRLYEMPFFDDAAACILLPKSISFLLPSFFPFHNFWWESSIYLGIPTALLASCSLIFIKKGIVIRYFLSSFLGFFLLFVVLSTQNPFLDFYLNSIPNLHFLYYPNRLRLMSNFFFILMACFCLDSLCRPVTPRQEKWLRIYFSSIGIILLVVISIYVPLVYSNSVGGTVTIGFVSKLNSIAWTVLLCSLSLTVLILLYKQKEKVLTYCILFLLVVDIFTFWSRLGPIQYKYGYGWNMRSPKSHFEHKKINTIN